MTSHAQGASLSSSSTVHSRSIVEALQELQRQIQAYGLGPFSPEQAKELENLKILYIKAKQQYEKQLKLLQQSSLMANQPTTIETTAVTGIQIPVSTTPTMGITPAQTQQQAIKEQQANMIQQLQRNAVAASISTQPTTQSIINAQVLGQPALQIVGSVSNFISNTGGTIAMVSTMSDSTTKNQILYATANKQQVVSRPQTSIRPTLSAINMTGQTIATGVSPLTAQQQLRAMGITANQRSEGTSQVSQPIQVLNRRKLQDLLHEIDPRETMDEDVEEVLLQIADDFIENIVGSASQLAKHRKSNTLEVKDIQLHLDRHWNMWIPGFGNEDLRPHKKVATADAHRQRMALIKKSLKK
eukprot:gene2641-3058_t